MLLVDAAVLLGRLALAAAVWSAVANARKRREAYRLDIAFFLVVLAVGPVLTEQSLFGTAGRAAFVALLPYVTLRLVRHFREVPRLLNLASAIVPVVVFLTIAWFQPPFPSASARSTVSIFAAAGLLPGAWAFIDEARRSIGVKNKRLVLAAGGTGTLLVSFILTATILVTGTDAEWRVALGPVSRSLASVSFICFFLAFAPPHWLTERWRNLEKAYYLAESHSREPEDRGKHAGNDLVKGASRCLGGSVAVVARRLADSSELGVVAASDKGLLGDTFTPGDGLVGQVVASGIARMGRLSECGPDVARLLAPYGDWIVVAPIEADATAWGVVIVMHPRGALFPEDDRTILSELGRYAASALDHAALIRRRRELDKLQAGTT
jgi:hypothetical protein